jgi:hypothetical protein
MQRCRCKKTCKETQETCKDWIKIELPYLSVSSYFFYVDGSLPVMILQAYYGISAISSIVLHHVASCVVASAVGSYAIHLQHICATVNPLSRARICFIKVCVSCIWHWKSHITGHSIWAFGQKVLCLHWYWAASSLQCRIFVASA